MRWVIVFMTPPVRTTLFNTIIFLYRNSTTLYFSLIFQSFPDKSSCTKLVEITKIGLTSIKTEPNWAIFGLQSVSYFGPKIEIGTDMKISVLFLFDIPNWKNAIVYYNINLLMLIHMFDIVTFCSFRVTGATQFWSIWWKLHLDLLLKSRVTYRKICYASPRRTISSF